MSIRSALRCAALAATIGALGVATPGPVRAQAYTGIDCSNPDFFQDCKYYSDVYGYPSAGYAPPYYAYGLPVVAGVVVGAVPFFHRRQPFVRFRGAAVHRQ